MFRYASRPSMSEEHRIGPLMFVLPHFSESWNPKMAWDNIVIMMEDSKLRGISVMPQRPT
jgi:hypothetical protein